MQATGQASTQSATPSQVFVTIVWGTVFFSQTIDRSSHYWLSLAYQVHLNFTASKPDSPVRLEITPQHQPRQSEQYCGVEHRLLQLHLHDGSNQLQPAPNR